MDCLKGSKALQRDLNRPQSWAITSHMKFNTCKCWILRLGWGNPGYTYKLGEKGLKRSPAEKDLRV